MIEVYTRVTVEAFWIFPLLDNDATIGGLCRELTQYIGVTQDVVIDCDGKKVEWGGSTRRVVS